MPPEQALADALGEVRERAVAATHADLDAGRSELSELEARRWAHDNRAALDAHARRGSELTILDRARDLTGTTALSRKKSEVAEHVVSRAFQDRFRRELSLLRGHRVSVRMERSRVARGHALHQVRVQAPHALPPGEIMSDGEGRIISLAAFLADARGMPAAHPFIFDDPISSLDQDFEEAVVARLVELSRERQVIVFTHRVSLLALLKEAAGKPEPAEICLRKEAWGAGQPADFPLSAQKPRQALKALRDHRLAQARKKLQSEGRVEYHPLAKSICSDFRSLLERVVESVLLGDIVQRFGRGVQTKNKLAALAAIQLMDTDFIDALMTRYSAFEHSQPGELCAELPEPDELQRDLDSLISWIADFDKRAGR